MEFKLIQTFIRDLRLEYPQGDVGDGKQELRYSPVYREDRAREFAVAFDLTMPLKPDGSLTLKFMAIFETSEDISEDFKNTHFPKVNAAAVAYPYLRAFVGQFADLCGFDRCTLPIRNFIRDQSPPDPKAQPSESPPAGAN